MCGISGIINKNQQSVPKDLIEQTNNLILHRGPDSFGYFFYKNLGLGHRRLAIIDLSNDGCQPMDYMGRYVLVFNGEIYNYIELKAELSIIGYEFISKSDTEVILAAYDHWGIECVSHFNGMWAFALLDMEKDVVFISRDRFGIKPVYYCSTKDYFVFGSEIKQLLPFFEKNIVEESNMVDYLAVGLEDHTESTFFKGIKKLLPSHSMTINLADGSNKINQYFDLPLNFDFKNLTESESIESFKKVFLDAIKIRLRSDVKVGTCLSGGLDSSAITHYASKMYFEQTGEKFMAFHVVTSEDPLFNELPFVEELIKNLPVELVKIDGGPEAVRENIDKVIWCQEEPFGSPSIVLQFLLMKKARELNCKVLLDGQGGDETLLGYERYYPSLFLGLTGFDRVKFFVQVIRHSKLGLLELLKYILYFTNKGIRLNFIKKRSFFLKKETLNKLSSEILSELSSNYTNIEKLQKQELFSTQLPHLLRYEDKNSMAFAIETRLPFLDYRNVINSLSIPYKYKINKGWSKYILRKAIQDDIPDAVVWRKNKNGFELPELKMFESLENEFLELLENSRIVDHFFDGPALKGGVSKMDPRVKWRIYNLLKWEKVFNVKIHE